MTDHLRMDPKRAVSDQDRKAIVELNVGDACALIDSTESERVQRVYVVKKTHNAVTVQPMGWSDKWQSVHDVSSTKRLVCTLTDRELGLLGKSQNNDLKGQEEWLVAFRLRRARYETDANLSMKHLLFKVKPFADLTIECKDGSIKAHRALLSVQSSVFEAMLQSKMHEGLHGHVQFQDVPMKLMNAILQFAYTQEFEMDTKIDHKSVETFVLPLIKLAHYLGFALFLPVLGSKVKTVTIETKSLCDAVIALIQRYKGDEAAATLCEDLKIMVETSVCANVELLL